MTFVCHSNRALHRHSLQCLWAPADHEQGSGTGQRQVKESFIRQQWGCCAWAGGVWGIFQSLVVCAGAVVPQFYWGEEWLEGPRLLPGRRTAAWGFTPCPHVDLIWCGDGVVGVTKVGESRWGLLLGTSESLCGAEEGRVKATCARGVAFLLGQLHQLLCDGSCGLTLSSQDVASILQLKVISKIKKSYRFSAYLPPSPSPTDAAPAPSCRRITRSGSWTRS